MSDDARGKFSPELYNEDLAPTDEAHRTWNMWNIAALWVGMSVCIPTYMLASSLIAEGIAWSTALGIIFLGNCIVVIPMILNAHAGTKYGIPFPVLARVSFGTRGAHVPSLLRALVACGWFGIQTWIGGQAIHALLGAWIPDIWAFPGREFVAYIFFWLLNMYYVWNGTESIRFLETWAAPVLLGIGLCLLYWGASQGGGLAHVLSQSEYFQKAPLTYLGPAPGDPSAIRLGLETLKDRDGSPKARWVQIGDGLSKAGEPVLMDEVGVSRPSPWREFTPQVTFKPVGGVKAGGTVYARFDDDREDPEGRTSSVVQAPFGPGVAAGAAGGGSTGNRYLTYLLWLTAMVGFWATLALNIPDITRFAQSQRDQMLGQAMGLPGTMLLYSFIGVAVTCSTLVIFPDVVIAQDAIWDPTKLLARFEDPIIIIVSMFGLAVATLTTNIAANIVSPANSFSNAFPQLLSYRAGGVVAAVIGVLSCPWLLLDAYASWLVTYSGLLGPVIGILLADYYTVRGGELDVDDLYRDDGQYSYVAGFNLNAVISLAAGIGAVMLGKYVEALSWLFTGAWFTGFIISFILYTVLMKTKKPTPRPEEAAA